MELISEIITMRRDIGMSQRELGVTLGKNRDHVKDMENGRKRIPAEDYLKIKELWDRNILKNKR